jgi:hypothetical protein
MPTGVSSATVSVNLSVKPSSGVSGSWGIELKAMRDISGTPTQIGTTQSASSDWESTDNVGDNARFLFSISDSSIPSGSNTWRIYGRVASGGTRAHTITGSVSVTA